ncbi:Superfamily II DNA and RNA helicase [Deinococcus reticulitermitis]|uniref:RNA helicase n=1 Tax=Deinococcus reticulitermitis TaxID=856736 RepID=A0A1H7B7Z3_9DEIO|nr:DEAD/DEAH box helicase [Deinococcus reticulitermitis]SEJ73548.1 Superfamily II DNA and RNA helicase [Deinococcus reticulitermitis]
MSDQQNRGGPRRPQQSNQQNGPRRDGQRPRSGSRPQSAPEPLANARIAFGESGDWQAEPIRQQPQRESRPQSEQPRSGQPGRQPNENRAQEPRRSDRGAQGGDRRGRPRAEQADLRPDVTAPTVIQLGSPDEWRKLLDGREPTPVQEYAIPQLIAGRDVIATARTGSGKTLAFLIPAAARGIGLTGPTRGMAPEVLIVSPTRELAVQIRDVARELGMSAGRITGGITPAATVREASAKGVVSGTPGRLKDLIGKRELGLSHVRYVVLDEADELLSLGFLKDVEWIVNQARAQARSGQIQVALASATFPDEVRAVAARVLRNPVRIDIEPPSPAEKAPLAPGEIVAAGEGRAEHVAHDSTREDLLEHAAQEIREALREPGGCALVFCRTKALAKRRAEQLGRMLPGEQVVALQGNMDQRKRERVMAELRDGSARVLVATDIAGRGIDLPEVRLVIHADVATTSEDHVHRSGRTARAGRGGRNLVLLIPEQRQRWAQVRRGLPEHLHPPKTAQEHVIDRDIQEKQGRGSGNGVDSGRQGSGRQGSGHPGGYGRPERSQGHQERGGGPRRGGRR